MHKEYQELIESSIKNNCDLKELKFLQNEIKKELAKIIKHRKNIANECGNMRSATDNG